MRHANPSSTVRQLRNRALFHAAAHLAGRPHDFMHMAQWYRECHPGLVPNVIGQWRRASQGSTIVGRVREDLNLRLPALGLVFSNPLWSVLSEAKSGKLWNELADTIRVADRPLDFVTGNLSRQLFDRVDWQCLCLHIVLLRTTHSYFSFHRQWLEMNFVKMLGWALIQSPLRDVSPELIDLIRLRVSPCVISDEQWARLSGFNISNFELLEQYYNWRWLDSNDQYLALFSWSLSSRFWDLLIECLRAGGTPSMPLPLKRSWQRNRARWEDHPISLEGYRIDFPGEEWVPGTGPEKNNVL